MSFTKIRRDEVIWSKWSDSPNRHAQHLWLFLLSAGMVAAILSYWVFVDTPKNSAFWGALALYFTGISVAMPFGNYDCVQYFRASQVGIEVTLEQVNGFRAFWKRCEISEYQISWEMVTNVDIIRRETEGAEDLFTTVCCDIPLKDKTIVLSAKHLEEALKSCNRIRELMRGSV